MNRSNREAIFNKDESNPLPLINEKTIAITMFEIEMGKMIENTASIIEQTIQSSAKEPNAEKPVQSSSQCEDEVLIARVKEGDERAMRILFEKYKNFIISTAKKYNKDLPIDELEQIGRRGFLKAIENWDFSKNTVITTYATPKILGLLRQTSRKHATTIEHNQRTISKIQKYCANFFKQHNRPPAAKEIASDLRIPQIKAEMCLNGLYHPLAHLQNSSGTYTDENPTTIEDRLGTLETGYEEFENAQSREFLFRKLKELFYQKYNHRNKERAWYVFINRMGFNEEQEQLSLEEIGKNLGISKQAVKMIEDSVLNWMRKQKNIITQAGLDIS
ncbi:MAG: sigma-70 family RNA polymerase sigma factor [Candidatus Gracilibacteria bacterium]|nr:sigma-70 family RNA polymerase sigma factor [Candidatus Gracilibacteria bacterium]